MAFHRTVLVMLSLALGLWFSTARADDLVVFAAASTTDAITEIGAAFTAKTGHGVRASHAASSTLAKQIEQGAPAHIFISANGKWTDYLDEKNLLAAGSRMDLLSNALVLVAPKDSATPDMLIDKGLDLAAALQGGRLAMGDPDHVPAGIYAKEALTRLGLWDELSGRTARMNDVRSALALVERGETPLGIVYATDVGATKNVRVIATFPAWTHAPVTYPAAVVAGKESAATKEFMAFLVSEEAAALFKAHGFSVK